MTEKKVVSISLSEAEVFAVLRSLKEAIDISEVSRSAALGVPGGEDQRFLQHTVGNKILTEIGVDCNFSMACESKFLWEKVMSVGFSLVPTD